MVVVVERTVDEEEIGDRTVASLLESQYLISGECSIIHLARRLAAARQDLLRSSFSLPQLSFVDRHR